MAAPIRHHTRPIWQAIRNTVARAVVHLVDDGRKLQRVQLGVLADETVDDAEHFQPYGFSSVPLVGAEAVAIFPGGNRAHPLLIAVADRRYRPTGSDPGEVTVYNHTGATAVFKANGDIVLTPAPGRKVRIGGDSASDPPALSSELADLKARIAAWSPVANDGGASLQPVIAAWPVAGATNVDVE